MEFRYYHRRYTLHDLGIHPPITDRDGTHYIPNVLQYRYKMRVTQGSTVEMVWSDWTNVPVVKEGSPEDGHAS